VAVIILMPYVFPILFVRWETSILKEEPKM
jgi:hypothetical protein